VNIFDRIAAGTYQPKPYMPDRTRYLLAKQIPSITDKLAINTAYGTAIITDRRLIDKIKATIEQHFK